MTERSETSESPESAGSTDGTHSTDSTDSTDNTASARTTELLISVAGPEAMETEPRLLALWLTEDPALGGREGIRVELRKRPPDADSGMGLGEDVFLFLAERAVAIGEALALDLVRSLYNHLRNRRDQDLTVTVRRKVKPGVVLELRSDRSLGRAELKKHAKELAKKLREDLG